MEVAVDKPNLASTQKLLPSSDLLDFEAGNPIIAHVTVFTRSSFTRLKRKTKMADKALDNNLTWLGTARKSCDKSRKEDMREDRFTSQLVKLLSP